MELEARISAAFSSGASFFGWFRIEASAKNEHKFSSPRERRLGTRQRISVCCLNCLYRQHFSWFWYPAREAAWPSGQRVGLAIRRSRVRVPLRPLTGFVLGRAEFKFSATLVNSQLVAFCQLGFLIVLCCI